MNVQQSINAILKILFKDYHLTDHSFVNSKIGFNDDQPKVQGKFGINEIEATRNKFIGYIEDSGCLAVARVVRNSHKNALIAESYSVKVQLPSLEALYNKMVTHGIDLSFSLRLFPYFVSSFEAHLQTRVSNHSNLTPVLNALVKKFIWKLCQERNEKVEQPSL